MPAPISTTRLVRSLRDRIKAALAPYATGTILTAEGAARLATRLVQLYQGYTGGDPISALATAYTVRPDDGEIRRVDIRHIAGYGWVLKITYLPERPVYLLPGMTPVPETVEIADLQADGGCYLTHIDAYNTWLRFEKVREM